jgi:hypothetical protein
MINKIQGGLRMKRIGLWSVLMILVAVLSVFSAFAAEYDFTKIEVDNVEITAGGDSVFAERGQDLDVAVWFRGIDNGISVDNVKVKAWISGYEYGDIEDVTETFEVESGVSYKKTLTLELPEDMDGSDNYVLHVMIEDRYDSIEFGSGNDVVLRIQEKRHKLVIQDVILNPGLSVEAGKPIYAVVRVENLGDKKEEDIKVKLSIPKLGIETRDYIDELVAHECEDGCDEDEEDSASSNELMLKIPESAKAGEYQLLVEVEYNRGHDVTSESYTLNVKGVVEEEAEEEETIVTFDSETKKVEQGEGIIYKLSIGNLGVKSKSYTFEVSGTEGWATARVDPSVLSVAKDSTGEAYVYVSVDENAAEGTHVFNVKVLSNGVIVEEANLGTEVEKDVGTSVWTAIKYILVILFIVLMAVLIILAIALAVKRSGKSEEEEPSTMEAQTYYYYPKY